MIKIIIISISLIFLVYCIFIIYVLYKAALSGPVGENTNEKYKNIKKKI